MVKELGQRAAFLGLPFFIHPRQPLIYFVSLDLSILDISYKRNHMTCDLLCLASFTQHNVFKVHPCCSVDQNFIPF